MSSYHPSEEALAAIGLAATILSIVSTGFCLIVLVAAAWVYSVPETRHTIDRISFRLMILSMVFGAGYDMCYFLAEPRFAIIDPASIQCKVVMYWQIATLGAVNYLITCIAINLMLSVHFALNPLTMRLERWYISVSLFVAFVVPIVPAALGHFGADPVYDACYFTAPNLRDRLRNFVLDVYLWQTLASIIACVCVLITLTSLFKSGRDTAKALLYRNTDTFCSSRDQTILSLDTDTSHSRWRPSWLFRRERSSTYQLQDQFLSIASRVALYPVVLVITNAVLTAGDLYLSASGSIDNRAEYGLYIVYYMLYGGRNIILASIGMFVDPGLPRGVRLAWRLARSKPTAGAGAAHDEEGDLDFMSALNSTPFREATGRSPVLDRSTATRMGGHGAGSQADEYGSPPLVWHDLDVTETKDLVEAAAEAAGQGVKVETLPVNRAQGRERRHRKEQREQAAMAELEDLCHRM